MPALYVHYSDDPNIPDACEEYQAGRDEGYKEGIRDRETLIAAMQSALEEIEAGNVGEGVAELKRTIKEFQ